MKRTNPLLKNGILEQRGPKAVLGRKTMKRCSERELMTTELLEAKILMTAGQKKR